MTLITIPSTTLSNYNGSTATLKILADQDFVTSDGANIARNYVRDGVFYKTVNCTVSGGVVTLPSYTLHSTTDSSVPNGTYTAILYDRGRRVQAFYSGWRIPTVFGSTPSWEQLSTFNGVQPTPLRLDYPTLPQVQTLIDAALSGFTASTSYKLSSYASLSAAISSIGSTKAVLDIDADQTVSTDETIPSTLRLRPAGGLLTNSGGSLTFQGDPGFSPDETRPIFSGFSPGDVTFSNGPRKISSSLWDDADWSERARNAIGAFSGEVEIVVHPGGTLASRVIIGPSQTLSLTAGTFENDADLDFQIILNDNSSLKGAGMFSTFLKESSVAGRNYFVYASGVRFPLLDGYNENITVSDFSVVGQTSQTYNSAAASINLGNTRDGYVERVGFLNVHQFAAYVGGFGTSGHFPDGWAIRNCLVRGIGTQAIGCTSGRNGQITGNQFLDISPTTSAAFAAVIDLEPNSATDYLQNVLVADNTFDGRNAQNSWTGIVAQAVSCLQSSGVTVARNKIIGAETSSWYFSGSNVNTANDTITLPDHKIDSGRRIIANAVSGTLPSPLTGSFYWATVVDKDTIKLSDSFANYQAGIFVNLTTTGSGTLRFVPGPWLVNGIMMYGLSDSDCHDNVVIGGSQHGVVIGNSERPKVHSNSLIQVGGGGNTGAMFTGCIDGRIRDNQITTTSSPLSQSADATENELSHTVTTSSTGNTVTITGGDASGSYPWWSGKTVTINGVDYVVDAVTDTQHFTVTANPGNQTGVAMASKFSSNRYRDNDWGTLTLSSTGASVVYSNYTDYRKKGTVTIDPTSIAANTVSSQTFTLTGAHTGDTLILNPPTTGLTAGLLVLHSFVSATNQITIVFQNSTGSSIDQTSVTWNYTLLR